MSVLVWDQTGEHFYETGVEKGVLFPMNSSGVYQTGVAWNGLTAFNASPSGADNNDIYADDIKYLSLQSAETFGATIEAYTYPDEWALCDGSAEPAGGITIGQQPRMGFGFVCKTLLGNDVAGNDYGYKLHFVYGAKAQPSESGYQTVNDSPEAISFSWTISTTPVTVSGYKPVAHLTIDSTKIDATVLGQIEDIIYGTAGADSRLPLPDEIIELAGGTGNYDLVLNRASAGVKVGSTFALTATTTPAGETVTWQSSDTDKATVTNAGVVAGVAAGTATITASFTKNDKTYSDTCVITVTAAS